MCVQERGMCVFDGRCREGAFSAPDIVAALMAPRHLEALATQAFGLGIKAKGNGEQVA